MRSRWPLLRNHGLHLDKCQWRFGVTSGRFDKEFGCRICRDLECTVKWLATVMCVLLSGSLGRESMQTEGLTSPG